jgi:ATP/maltotriose-dependent transcriptional regulator MalT
VRKERAWPDALVKRLQLVAQIFSNALARKRADQALRESERRLSLAAEYAERDATGRTIRSCGAVRDITLQKQAQEALHDLRGRLIRAHEEERARLALEAGALGYVLKHSAPSELIAAIRAALDGKTWLTPAVAGEVLQSVKGEPEKAGDPVASLTPRQREILQLLAEGRSAKEVGAALGVSARTVEFHKYQRM